MKIVIIILLLAPLALRAQVTPMNYDLREIELLKFVEKNLDSISKYHPNEKGFVLEFKVNQKSKLITDLFFYNLEDTLSSKPIKTWPDLEKFIRKMYFFHPSMEFYEQDNSASLLNMKTGILLNKKYLKKQIKHLERYFPNCADNHIKPNTDFTLEIKSFQVKLLNHPTIYTLENIKIESTLDGLKSGIIQLDEKFFCYLNVSNTSGDQDCYSETKLFIYLIEGRTTILVSEAFFINHSSGSNTVRQSVEYNGKDKASEGGFEQLDCVLNFK